MVSHHGLLQVEPLNVNLCVVCAMDWGQEEIRCTKKAVKPSEVASQDGEAGSEEG